MDLKYLSPETIIFSDKTEKQHVIREMVTHLEKLGKISNSLRYYSQVIHRESLENTGIGNGFAIPHARTDSIEDLIILFASLRDGIEYQSYDGVPVRYVMLSIFPTIKSTTYLFYVSMMARIFSDEKNISRLDNSKTPEEIYSIFDSASDIYFNTISEKPDVARDSDSVLSGIPSAELDLLIRLDRLSSMQTKNSSQKIAESIESLKSLIDKRSLAYYERMRNKCENPFAYIEKQACSGCHMAIPPIQMNAIRERKSIQICLTCGRFLIHL